MKTKRLTGIGVSSGIVKGRAYLFKKTIKIPEKRKTEEIEKEKQILRAAKEKAKKEISDAIKKIEADFGANFSQIFDIHLALLEDPMLFSVSEKNIENGMNASYAFFEAIKNIIDNFSFSHFTQLGRTIEILHDISTKIFYYLGEIDDKKLDIGENVILVAKSLTPYDALSILKDKIIGIICGMGNQTSHAAIFARGLRIPAVFGVSEIESISQDDIIILDGRKGLVIINPRKNDEKLYEKRKKEEELEDYFKKELIYLSPKTKDGHRINLAANIEFLEEVSEIKKENFDGIGLLRTEFLFLEYLGIPDENHQFNVYSEISDIVYPNYVTIRTFDINEDKIGLFFKERIELPSSLRGIRFLLKYKEILKTQLRAILRANKRGNLKIMFPMVTCREELEEAISILSEVKNELKKEKAEFEENIEIGTMIETPAAAIACDTFIDFIDFFSIGTNDLVKYTLIADRTDIKSFYEPLDPSILRLIKNVVDVGKKFGKSIGICGEIASDPLYTPLLLGLGIDELSVNIEAGNEIRKRIRNITQEEAEKIKDKVFSLKKAKEIREFLENLLI